MADRRACCAVAWSSTEDALLSYLAYADRTGVITITETAAAKPAPPKGALPIAMHQDRSILEQAVIAVARRANDNATLVVPGVAAGHDTEVALPAVFDLIRQVENRLLLART
jgi:hypothetical protein